MSHSGAVYTLQVKVKRQDEYRLLGDLDGGGQYLGDAFKGYLHELRRTNLDQTKTVACSSTRLDDHDLFAMVQHGERGLVGEIVDDTNVLRHRQVSTDSQNVKCGVLFRLPRASSLGWLCVHVNHGRSCKGLLVDALTERFRGDFSHLMLEVRPCQLAAAFRQAVDDDMVEKVTLSRLERATDRANAASAKWVPPGVGAKLALEIAAQAGHVTADLLKGALRNDRAAWDDLLRFGDIEFERAVVQVQLPNGRNKTFNLERPDAGHPLTEKLEDLRMSDGEPTEDSLRAALGKVVTDLA